MCYLFLLTFLRNLLKFRPIFKLWRIGPSLWPSFASETTLHITLKIQQKRQELIKIKIKVTIINTGDDDDTPENEDEDNNVDDDDDIVYVELEKKDRGLGFGLVDYQVNI